MLYISTGCVSGKTIRERVELLAEEGFYNLELTGGTRYYHEYIDDLLELKKKYPLNYLVHNYFPPPEQPFVLNLGSQRTDVIKQSLSLCKQAIKDAATLGSSNYSFHAGFYFDPKIRELGAVLDKRTLNDPAIALKTFKENVGQLKEAADQYDIKLYIENNVVNQGSFLSFEKNIPAMLLNSDDYQALQQELDFNLLLDVAHLKVSINSLELDYPTQLSTLIKNSEYLHLSDNNSLKDENKSITNDSDLFKLLSNEDLNNKIIVLEVYEDLEQIKASYDLIKSLIN
jgi:sugar phosphate isomerase/epimerase